MTERKEVKKSISFEEAIDAPSTSSHHSYPGHLMVLEYETTESHDEDEANAGNTASALGSYNLYEPNRQSTALSDGRPEPVSPHEPSEPTESEYEEHVERPLGSFPGKYDKSR